MLFVDEILYRHLTPADFRNIEGIKKPNGGRGGGGQTYIDLSGVEPKDAAEFFKYCPIDEINLKDGELEEGTPPFVVNAIQAGTNCAYSLLVYKRRPHNYTIRDQFNKRYPGWKAENGFPTVVGDGKPFLAGGSYENDKTDPYVQPIVEHLTVYIVRTINHLYFADYVSDSKLPASWPLSAGLNRLIKTDETSKYAGIIKPSELIQFVNQRESVDNDGV